MAKQPSFKKTVINGEFDGNAYSKPRPIGFGRSVEIAEGPAPIERVDLSRALRRTEMDEIILTVVRDYMEERVKKCYKEGLDKDLMSKLDKVYIKFYDPII